MLKKLVSRLMVFIVSLFIIGLGVATSGNAAEFSADMIQKSPMGTSKGKVFVKGENFRQELMKGGEKTITIFQVDKGVTVVLMPKERMYMEMPATAQKDMAPIDPKEMEKAGEKKYLGKETVNGYKCEKYRYTSQDPAAGTTIMWFSKKLNFPIKMEMEGPSASMSMEYKNIQEKKVPDSLFKIPAGYQKMSMPMMPKMPGMPSIPKQ